MKRIRIELSDVACLNNLSLASYKAAKGKRNRPEVVAYFQQFEANLNRLSKNIRDGNTPVGEFQTFQIRDPKKRTIHAACFEDRVFHHAVINLAGPVMDKALIDHTYACRENKGVHKAANYVQRNVQKYSWYVKIDIDKYFDSIDHDRLLGLLSKRFKGPEFIKMLERILASFETGPGTGLPIGALTSQHFANYYLNGLDRYVLEHLNANAYVRYMDDMIWWCDSKSKAKQMLDCVTQFAEDELSLRIKNNSQINRSQHGVNYCGYRVLPGTIRLSRRRKRQYIKRLKFWESAYLSGKISVQKLQNTYSSVHAIVDHADSLSWRKRQLALHPTIDV